ncbi:Hypothetical protein Minf_0420 [Methylacidiphilum infernorum V4]|uniref:Uncharacterized protein n=1 Tax=Methylacidiphilum infernorum (isolate V4) TaxID=481448 RepID=B3DYV6_METI4|nr:Hypothetical protein Minf_0420 [Methylacidiphilum infernorum V4]
MPVGGSILQIYHALSFLFMKPKDGIKNLAKRTMCLDSFK